MSAIAAILRFHGEPVREGEIERLVGAMKGRSPDGASIWREGCMALGHGMLHATPESLEEKQPLATTDGRFHLIWDGRLDNRDDLRHELSLHRVLLRDNTDAEIVLQLFLVCGERTPERLLGDFAFAVWDRVEQRLFCARDHIGARPFYYTLNDRCFALASEDEAMLCLREVSAEPNLDRVAYAVNGAFGAFDWAHSWLRDVRILMPGQWLAINRDRRLQLMAYWQMPVPEALKRAIDVEGLRHEFRAVFEIAVRDRLRVNGRVAAMMSGGMDSASVCSMATRLLGTGARTPLRTYSVVEDDAAACIESRSILRMIDLLGTEGEILRVPSFSGFATRLDLQRIAADYVHPVDESILLVAMMCLGAARAGDRVLLHGASGDVATDTPLYYLSHVRRDIGWRAALGELKLSAAHHTYLAGLTPRQILLRNMYHHTVPFALRRMRQRIRDVVRRPRDPWAALDEAFVVSRQLRLRQTQLTVRQEKFAAQSAAYDHWGTMFPTGVLRGLEGYERVAGHFGVEMRDPWADKRVLELMLRMPVTLKTRDGWTKHLIRKAFEADVGAEVVWRSDKTHLGWHFDQRAPYELSHQAPAVDLILPWARHSSANRVLNTMIATTEAWARRVRALKQLSER
jgi:asparagine synthase (glutamine-hydrolysing)